MRALVPKIAPFPPHFKRFHRELFPQIVDFSTVASDSTAPALPGLMMHSPLLISSLLRHAAKHHPDTLIVSQRHEEAGIGPRKLHRYTYKDMHGRSKQLGNILEELGVKKGDRLATLAMNTYR